MERGACEASSSSGVGVSPVLAGTCAWNLTTSTLGRTRETRSTALASEPYPCWPKTCSSLTSGWRCLCRSSDRHIRFAILSSTSPESYDVLQIRPFGQALNSSSSHGTGFSSTRKCAPIALRSAMTVGSSWLTITRYRMGRAVSRQVLETRQHFATVFSSLFVVGSRKRMMRSTMGWSSVGSGRDGTRGATVLPFPPFFAMVDL